MTDNNKQMEAENFQNIDPLKKAYRESITHSPAVTRSLELHKTALLCIDLQYLDAAPGIGVFADAEQAGVPLEAQEYYFDRLENVVLPNVRRLQDAFRKRGLEVIHTRIQSLTQDGRDRSPGHKRLGLHAAPGSKEAEFLEPVVESLVLLQDRERGQTRRDQKNIQDLCLHPLGGNARTSPRQP